MTTRKPKVYLLDILESINLIESFIDTEDLPELKAVIQKIIAKESD